MGNDNYRLVVQAWKGNQILEFILYYQTIEELFVAHKTIDTGLHLIKELILQESVNNEWVDFVSES